jgi:Holliday junction resolvasome RuvABC DNA-binding subunit
MIDYERAIKTPSRYFAGPQDVVEHRGLSTAAKITILLRWKHNALQSESSQAYNVTPQEESPLREVIQALHNLGYNNHQE